MSAVLSACGTYRYALWRDIYAFRATQPHELARADDPVGPKNDDWIATLCHEADCKIAAWGASVHAAPERVQEVAYMLDHDTGVFCLGLTADGHPKHPLYVPADATVVDYRHPSLHA